MQASAMLFSAQAWRALTWLLVKPGMLPQRLALRARQSPLTFQCPCEASSAMGTTSLAGRLVEAGLLANSMRLGPTLPYPHADDERNAQRCGALH